ncbi:hypothetical protein SK128_002759 [Halocaridina rubra]|uniref:RING-type domain-containing protein n=1 Tax=Halocaridina rubra TaxID=373956 RepID=A0AAN9A6W7_HALRR
MVDVMSWPKAQTQQPRLLEVRRERRFHHPSDLMLESVRRLTFSNWTVSYVDPDQLAKSGFFHRRTVDHVECVFCKGIVGYWDRGDQPDLEHRKHFPNCPFITGVVTGNIPITNQEDDIGRVYRLLDEYHTFRITSTRPVIKNANSQYDASPTEAGQLAFPQYNTPSARRQTYKNWPNGLNIQPDSLVEAGFFSVGIADWVQCFHCGGGLFGWREGDNPIADHFRYYPFCPYIRQHQTEDTHPQTWGDNVPPPSIIRPPTLSDSEAELLLAHPIARRLVHMGLSEESVKQALKDRLQTRGVLCTSMPEALEIVFDYDERERKRGMQHDYIAMNNNDTSKEKDCNSTLTETEQQHTQGTEDVDAKYHNLQREIDDLKRSVEQEEKRIRCRLCKTKKVEVVLQPCSHLHLCSACARPLDRCPTCGTFVRGTLIPILG